MSPFPHFPARRGRSARSLGGNKSAVIRKTAQSREIGRSSGRWVNRFCLGTKSAYPASPAYSPGVVKGPFARFSHEGTEPVALDTSTSNNSCCLGALDIVGQIHTARYVHHLTAVTSNSEGAVQMSALLSDSGTCVRTVASDRPVVLRLRGFPLRVDVYPGKSAAGDCRLPCFSKCTAAGRRHTAICSRI